MFSDVIIKADPFRGVDAANWGSAPIVLNMSDKQTLPLPEDAVERRAFRRFQVDAIALVRPVDSEFRATGPAFEATIVDLSASGIRLQHSDYVGSSLLAVKLRLQGVGLITLALSVLRSRPKDGHFEIAGRIIAKLASSD